MMKGPKSLLLLLAFTLAMMISASAQEHAAHQGLSPEQRRAHMDQMTTELELNEDQVTQFEQVHVEHMEKMAALRTEELSRNDFRAKAKILRKEHDEALNEILTEEQYQQFLAKRKEIWAAHSGNGGGQ